MENFQMPQSAALLLEGGSLRGLYTSGALDILIVKMTTNENTEHESHFHYFY